MGHRLQGTRTGSKVCGVGEVTGVSAATGANAGGLAHAARRGGRVWRLCGRPGCVVRVARVCNSTPTIRWRLCGRPGCVVRAVLLVQGGVRGAADAASWRATGVETVSGGSENSKLTEKMLNLSGRAVQSGGRVRELRQKLVARLTMCVVRLSKFVALPKKFVARLFQ